MVYRASQISARLSSVFNITGGATHNDVTITSFPFAQCYPGQTGAQGCIAVAAEPGELPSRADDAVRSSVPGASEIEPRAGE